MTGALLTASTAAVHVVAAMLPGEDPFRPGPDEARRWAQDELAKDGYGTSYLERAWQWLMERLGDLASGDPGGGGNTAIPPVLALVGALAIAAVVAQIVRSRRPSPPSDTRESAGPGTVFAGGRLPARTHRGLAEEALARGATARAAVEAFRALTAGLLERHLLDDADDRTAGEFALAAGGIFPDHRADLAKAAAAFNQARYGGPAPRPSAVRHVLDLADTLTAASPRSSRSATAPPRLGATR